MPKRRTAKQAAASRKNLEKARKSRSRNTSGSTVVKVNFGGPKSTADWDKRQESLAPSTLMNKYRKSLAGIRTAKTAAGRAHHEKKAEVFWNAYQKASKKK